VRIVHVDHSDTQRQNLLALTATVHSAFLHKVLSRLNEPVRMMFGANGNNLPPPSDLNGFVVSLHHELDALHDSPALVRVMWMWTIDVAFVHAQ
jgi:hypothetical protein